MRARAVWGWFVALTLAGAMAAAAQDRAYLQVEAQPSLTQARAAVERYAAQFDAVVGYALGTGWYAVALGPFADRAEADAARRTLRATGRIPFDAFVVEAERTAARIWPEDGAPPAPAPAEPAPEAAEVAPEPAETAPRPETLAEARRAEAQLDRPAREEVQRALAWFGHYDLAIDGAFGPGTRRAMTAWQEAEGIVAPTGVLTTQQRADLLDAWQSERAAFGFAPWRDDTAGIEVTLPLGKVAFDGIEAPFLRFTPVDGSGVEVLLISQEGSEATLAGLYEILQTLEVVPPEGPRERVRDRFTLTGRDDVRHTHAEARHSGGQIKGFMLIWPAGAEAQMARALEVMRDSFRSFGPALPDTLGQPASAVAGADLVAGLAVRRPARTLSGFFIDDTGRVLTSAALAEGCARLTIDDRHGAEVYLRDAGLGVAVLRPAEALAPSGYARFALTDPPLRSEIVLAGYALPEMTAPVLTLGRMTALEGLAGEAGLRRLALSAEPGEIGGPVFDRSGAVLGMLLPAQGPEGRILPEGISFAAASGAILELLRSNGVEPGTSGKASVVDLAALSRTATGMTVQVACWN